MATNVTINGTTYILPNQNDPAPWGTNLSDLLEALVEVAQSQVAPGDILNTSFSMSNNVTTPTAITGFSFDPAVVKTARVDYAITRSTTTTSFAEHGEIQVTYDANTSTWSYSLGAGGDAGITLSITAGQFMYQSSNLSGTNHQCTFSFRASAFS